MKNLKRWNSSMSDGCSVPKLLRLVVPRETPEQCRICERHDEAYYYGGSRAHRRAADRVLRQGLTDAGMTSLKAWCYWMAVRMGGAPWYRVKGISWAYGGAFFRYSREPAMPGSVSS